MSVISTIRFICSHPLNRGKVLEGVSRFLRWQIASRLLRDGDVVVPWVNGAKFRVRRGQAGLTGNIYVGLHEFEEMAFLLHLLRPEDLFVDVGANVGSYTVLAGAAIGSSCISVEPVPATFSALVENVRLNHREKQTECINAGLGETEGTLSFTTDADTVNHVVGRAETPMSIASVPVRTLDGLLGGRLPTLVKIDVEGYETQVIKGASRILGSAFPLAIIMELNGSGERYGFDEKALLQKMFAFGFGAYRYRPFERQLEKLAGRNATGGNTIFIRGEEFVAARLKEARKFRIGAHQL